MWIFEAALFIVTENKSKLHNNKDKNNFDSFNRIIERH